MTSKNNGGPAFPTTPDNYHHSGYCEEGMTLRQYYMAHAPITLSDAEKAMATAGAFEPTGNDQIQMLAKMRSAYADAMIAEGSK